MEETNYDLNEKNDTDVSCVVHRILILFDDGSPMILRINM